MIRHRANVLRRGLLEAWAIVLTACVVGFLGPFGTYLEGDFPARVGRWWVLLVGAYILVRPIIILWRWVAKVTALPRGSLVFWGVILSSFPMAWLWSIVGADEVRRLVGFAEMVPFSLLCALLVMAIARWASQADAHLLRYYDASRWAPGQDSAVADPAPRPGAPMTVTRLPRLYGRLKPGFAGTILALESEDHYVRVHGAAQSELLFLRLRDAIAEMDGVAGEQTHRSWWVARDAVADVTGAGRNREIVLTGGLRAPVARDSVDRLRRSGFLPDQGVQREG